MSHLSQGELGRFPHASQPKRPCVRYADQQLDRCQRHWQWERCRRTKKSRSEKINVLAESILAKSARQPLTKNLREHAGAAALCTCTFKRIYIVPFVTTSLTMCRPHMMDACFKSSPTSSLLLSRNCFETTAQQVAPACCAYKALSIIRNGNFERQLPTNSSPVRLSRRKRRYGRWWQRVAASRRNPRGSVVVSRQHGRNRSKDTTKERQRQRRRTETDEKLGCNAQAPVRVYRQST